MNISINIKYVKKLQKIKSIATWEQNVLRWFALYLTRNQINLAALNIRYWFFLRKHLNCLYLLWFSVCVCFSRSSWHVIERHITMTAHTILGTFAVAPLTRPCGLIFMIMKDYRLQPNEISWSLGSKSIIICSYSVC